MIAQTWIVQTSHPKRPHLVRKEIWREDRPLPLLGAKGRMRAFLEKTRTGFRVRDIGRRTLCELEASAFDLAHGELNFGGELHIRLERPRRAQMLSSRAERSRAAISTQNELHVYTCLGDWVRDDRLVGSAFEAPLHEFKLDGGTLTARQEGLVLELAQGDSIPLRTGQSVSVSREQLANARIRHQSGSGLHWEFRDILCPSSVEGAAAPAAATSEDLWFNKSLKGSFIGMIACLLLGASVSALWDKLWPKPAEEPLVPPQFAKIVYTPPVKKAERVAKGTTSAEAPATDAPKPKTQSSAVKNSDMARAFRSKSLQNAVQGLLKGGVTQFLSQQQNLAAGGALASSKANLAGFAAPSSVAGLAQGAKNVKGVEFAGMGGGAVGGTGVGYAKGERAGIGGQGKTFIAVLPEESTVEEGLTRDEVGEVIHRHLSDVRYCYESAILRTPNIEGKLQIRFTINGGGKVAEANVQSSSLGDPRLDDCILRRLMSWKFPNPKGGVDVDVSYPFIFKTLER